MKKWIIAVLLNLSAISSWAADLDGLGDLNQAEFEGLSRDLTAAFSYKAVAPAEPLGIAGLDVGLSVSVTQLEYAEVWNKATSSGDAIDTLIVPKLYLQKGLPLDFDIGVYFFTLPDSELEAWGLELKYALIDANAAMPAVAIRGAYTTLLGVDELKITTRSIDFSISKSISILTPYAGIGLVWGSSKPLEAAALTLSTFDVTETKVFLGVSYTPSFFNLALELEKVGGNASYSLKVGIAI